MRRALSCIAVLIVLIASPTVHAQALADRIPADAVAYFGWSGSDHLGPAFEGSHWQKILQSSNLGAIATDFVPHAIIRLAAQNGQASTGQALAAVWTTVWRHPTALYFGGILGNPGSGRDALPIVALLCDAGDDAPRLEQALHQLLVEAGPKPPAEITHYGSLVALSIGKTASFDALLGGPAGVAPAQPLNKAPQFSRALSELTKDPVLACYINAEAAVALGDRIAAQNQNNQSPIQWPAIRDALGLASLKQIALTAGFDGPDWQSAEFVAAPNPRQGLLAMFDSRGVSSDLMAAIPKSATLFAGGRCDIAALFTHLHDAIGQINPEWPPLMDKGLGAASMAIGANVRHDILEPLGDEWAVYASPEIGGTGGLGLTLVNHLRDADKFKHGLTMLEVFTDNIISSQLQSNPNLHVSFQQTKSAGGLEIHYLAVPFISPAWTIADGNLYLGFYPQVVEAAARYVAHKGPGIAANEKFIAMKKRLGPPAETGSVTFVDLPAVAGDGYQSLLAVSRIYLGFGDLFGVPAPALALPPLDVVLQNISPAGSVSWSDDAGWHSRSISPFPGSTALGGGDNMGTATLGEAALFSSILLPSLNRARETANRVQCASNMRQIGMGLLLYANDHKGIYPPDLGSVAANEDIGLPSFVCPDGHAPTPPDAATMTPAQKADWVNAHSDYTFLAPNSPNTLGPDWIILSENPNNHHDGMNLLYGDGHVEYQALPNALKQLEAQKNGNAPKGQPAPPL